MRGSEARTKIPEMSHVIEGMAAEVKPLLHSHPTVQRAAQSVTKFISAPLSSHYSKGFELVKRAKSSVLGTFISIVYAKALLLLLSSPNSGHQVVADLKKTLASPESAIDEYLGSQGKLGEDFVGHLVTFSEIEAQVDPHFDKIMDQARKFFLQHKPRESTRDPLSDPKSGLDLLKIEDDSAWWRVPASLAFVMTVSG
jgi:hypothetical protein